MATKLPVYDIKAFGEKDSVEFYANRLKPHVATHAFTNLPHKHDFYLVMLVTQGRGTHEIDFTNYKVTPGLLFIMRPGQMHYWKLSKDINGYVFFHSKTFFEETNLKLQDYPFYKSFQSVPHLKLSGKTLSEIKNLMNSITEEYKNDEALKMQKLQALVNLTYITISRNYKAGKISKNQTYLSKAIEFETLIEKHFKELKSATDYASRLNISEKHLNRITRFCFNKTSTQLIAERIILEAKRLLIHTQLQVTQIAYELGYVDKSYFVRFFKKNAGETPLGFLEGSRR
ncbi:MAG TPA: helix-turn-helix transcriptional regulator [Bacteroidia bacterium]|jgi:AraC family transcriptional activator of pobA|nr:helix-turn-helix transcriptional regulator [Bacteroidia bacterium]